MSRPLRLCFIGPAASISFRRWVDWFALRGHETTVITVEPAEGTRFRQIDVTTWYWPKKIGRLLSGLKTARLVRQLAPDVVHVHYARGLAWGLALRDADPLVVTPWGSDVLEEQGAFREPYAKALTRRLLRNAALVTVHSQFMEAQVRRVVPDLPRLAQIGWGVDLSLFRPGLDVTPLRQRWGIGEDRQVILSPRLAQPFYQHERLIRALPAVLEKIPNATVVVSEHCADTAYVQSLRALASELGISGRVRFVGTIPYSEMPLWFNLARAVVMVPRSDGMPNSLLEAMACGVVPILNRLPQYAELIRHGENGFFVDPDGGDLAGPLVGVLSDPVARRHIATRNREKISEEADQDREMARMEEWYQKLALARSA
jgi:glycosyltransferase involved in cell wall biosynthesis